MDHDRLSGILLHVTSLPSLGGIGDFGPAAYAFVDFLAAAKQRLWQVLPLGPGGYGGSPYSALSAFAGNPLLISVERLVDEVWLPVERLQGSPGQDGSADFAAATAYKTPLLEEAAASFLRRADGETRARYETFCQENSGWLPDYAMFNVLRRRFAYVSWNHWPAEFARRKPEALASAQADHAHELALEQTIQFFFDQQWRSLRDYCRQRDIRVLGDIAIFVDYDSADVWTHPNLFELGEDLNMVRVSGVPPDYFSATGQRWGNPLYRWDVLRNSEFDWWVQRIRRALVLYDMIRLDHFRGFEAYWSIAADEPTAINGRWIECPGHELFDRLKQVFGELPFIAEDLGLITPEVDELREHFGMPGMRVLQFGFSDRGAHIYLPHKYVPNTVVYTGTHDNNTTLGWWCEGATAEERAHAQTYLGPIPHDGDIVWSMIRAAASSVANLCIFPMQDVLHLGQRARINTPSESTGNWTWRYNHDALHSDLATTLASLMEMTDRDGSKPATPPPAAEA